MRQARNIPEAPRRFDDWQNRFPDRLNIFDALGFR